MSSQLYKSQAEELISAVDEILLGAENKNAATGNSLSAARQAAIDTEEIYSGVAANVMNGGEDSVSFPTG